MKIVKIRLRKRGQITLPIEVRERWGVGEGSELLLMYDDRKAILKPKKKIRVKEYAGILGEASEDEVFFSIVDPSLLPLYLEEKYGGKHAEKPSKNT